MVETELQEIHECQSETNIGTQLNSPITTANIRQEFIPFVFRTKNSVPLNIDLDRGNFSSSCND